METIEKITSGPIQNHLLKRRGAAPAGSMKKLPIPARSAAKLSVLSAGTSGTNVAISSPVRIERIIPARRSKRQQFCTSEHFVPSVYARVKRRKFLGAALGGTAARAANMFGGGVTGSFPSIDSHIHLFDVSRPQGV